VVSANKSNGCRKVATTLHSPSAVRKHEIEQTFKQSVRSVRSVRLCARYRRLAAAGKPKVAVTTAIAREIVGFIWAIEQMAVLKPRSGPEPLSSEQVSEKLGEFVRRERGGEGDRLGQSDRREPLPA
jgi:hypothetical protein